MESTLIDLQNYLRAEGATCRMETEAISQPMLVVARASGDRDPLEVSLTEVEGPPGAAEAPPYLRLLQLFCVLPFPIAPAQLEAASQLTALINARVELPGFAVDQLHRRVYYRYMYAFREAMDGAVVQDLLVATGFLVDAFGTALKRVAAGECSVEDAVRSSDV